jgi:hypothetical protein
VEDAEAWASCASATGSAGPARAPDSTGAACASWRVHRPDSACAAFTAPSAVCAGAARASLARPDGRAEKNRPRLPEVHAEGATAPATAGSPCSPCTTCAAPASVPTAGVEDGSAEARPAATAAATRAGRAVAAARPIVADPATAGSVSALPSTLAGGPVRAGCAVPADDAGPATAALSTAGPSGSAARSCARKAVLATRICPALAARETAAGSTVPSLKLTFSFSAG